MRIYVRLEAPASPRATGSGHIHVLEERPFSYCIVTDGQSIHEQFGVASYPTHFGFGADGTCATAMSGHTPGIGRMLAHEIRVALEESR